MILRISTGMILECLTCHKPILIDDRTMKIDAFAEYIQCCNCNSAHDVQSYHMFGKVLENESEG